MNGNSRNSQDQAWQWDEDALASLLCVILYPYQRRRFVRHRNTQIAAFHFRARHGNQWTAAKPSNPKQK